MQMRYNKLSKLICSLPCILIVLYFSHFLGICLILFRSYIYKEKNKYFVAICLITLGLIILIPEIVRILFNILDIDINSISYLDDILNSSTYTEMISYSKSIIFLGIILLMFLIIVDRIYRKVSNKFNSSIRNYINEETKKNDEISKKNDLLIKEKQERAKNTHVVYCKYCGADNIITENTSTCKFCRRKIEYKE